MPCAGIQLYPMLHTVASGTTVELVDHRACPQACGFLPGSSKAPTVESLGQNNVRFLATSERKSRQERSNHAVSVASLSTMMDSQSSSSHVSFLEVRSIHDTNAIRHK